jgi:hypothetical protein
MLFTSYERDTPAGSDGLTFAVAQPHNASRLDVARSIVIHIRLETAALADKPRFPRKRW